MKLFHCLRKSYMTLLETLIAMSLLSILLVFVFGIFRELSELSRLTEQSQKESFQMRYLESRLGFIFERVVNENASARKFFFYTQPTNQNFSPTQSLILTFNNEVRKDPAFSGDVLGRIYVDLEGRLCLAIWPLNVSDPYEYLQEEVLLNHVVNVRYSFYAAPIRSRNAKDIDSGEKIDPEKKTPEKDKWYDEWPFTYAQMPSMMKMIVDVAKNPDDLKEDKLSGNGGTRQILFHFVLPSSKNPVYYPPEGISS